MSTPELSKPKRLQGAYVSDKEIENIIHFLKKEGEPDYNYQVTEDTRTGGVSLDPGDSDPLLEEAIQIVIESGKASTSFLQRRLKIGYSRAARIIDLMEEIGVIGEGHGAKPREVLVESWPTGGAATVEVAEEQEDGYEDDDEFDEDEEEGSDDDFTEEEDDSVDDDEEEEENR